MHYIVSDTDVTQTQSVVVVCPLGISTTPI